ncbi:N-acetylglucosamine-6-phosphate deacetylase [Beijerinckiaceae bacterium]|nr:N-acetylglucosamine-6-phosphate deacetylase [Beijerinckiaceae bacterium]
MVSYRPIEGQRDQGQAASFLSHERTGDVAAHSPHKTPGPLQCLVADAIFDGERMLTGCAVLIHGGRIVDVVSRDAAPPDGAMIDLGAGSVLAPGFIDVQVNGGGGVLLNDEPTIAGIKTIVAAHRRFGTTGLLPTLITDRRETMERLAGIAEAALEIPGVFGFHLEGPFLNPRRKGVHPSARIRSPTPEDISLLHRFGSFGRSIVTLAPECVPDGFIADLAACGLRICAGHTDADESIIRRAGDEGLTGITHLFNAMSQMQARAPGAVGAALDEARFTLGLICDGYHVDPAMMRIAFRVAGRDRLMLVTDAMPTVGAHGAGFDLFGHAIKLEGTRLATEDGTLAGAHLDMMGAVRGAVSLMRVSLEDALVMASRTPARFLGLDGMLGAIRKNYRADLVAFDPNLTVTDTWVAGNRECHG